MNRVEKATLWRLLGVALVAVLCCMAYCPDAAQAKDKTDYEWSIELDCAFVR